MSRQSSIFITFAKPKKSELSSTLDVPSQVHEGGMGVKQCEYKLTQLGGKKHFMLPNV